MEQPETPDVEQPETPDTEQPETPDTEQPEIPDIDEPEVDEPEMVKTFVCTCGHTDTDETAFMEHMVRHKLAGEDHTFRVVESEAPVEPGAPNEPEVDEPEVDEPEVDEPEVDEPKVDETPDTE